MFLFRRRHHHSPLLLLILAIFGFRACRKWKHATPEEREGFRQKRRLFRSKLREACAVWEDDQTTEAGPQG